MQVLRGSGTPCNPLGSELPIAFMRNQAHAWFPHQLRYERLARGEPAQRPTLRPRGSSDLALSAEAVRAIGEMDEEEARSGSWRRLFPTADGHAHRHLFAQERPLNTLLVDVLHRRRAEAAGSHADSLEAIG